MSAVRATARGLLVALVMSLAAAPAIAGCRYTRFATLPVELKGTRVLLDGSINGQPQTMMLDSGSQDTWLTRKTADQLELKLRHSDTVAIGTGGESQLYTALIDEVKIGKVRWQRINLSVTWDADLPYGAIVGANFLFQRDVEFALQEKEIRFFEPDGCKDAFLAYWDANAVATTLEPAGPDDLRPTVEVLINGIKVRALIDSGAPTTVIDLAVAKRLGITPQSPGVTSYGQAGGIGKHQTDAWMIPLESFAIGEESIAHPRIQMQDLYGSLYQDERGVGVSAIVDGEPPLILGADFMRAHRLLFSTSQRKLYLSYLGGQVFGSPGVPEKEQ